MSAPLTIKTAEHAEYRFSDESALTTLAPADLGTLLRIGVFESILGECRTTAGNDAERPCLPMFRTQWTFCDEGTGRERSLTSVDQMPPFGSDLNVTYRALQRAMEKALSPERGHGKYWQTDLCLTTNGIDTFTFLLYLADQRGEDVETQLQYVIHSMSPAMAIAAGICFIRRCDLSRLVHSLFRMESENQQ